LVSKVPLAVRPARHALVAPVRKWPRATSLIPCCFLLAAVGLTAMIWVDPTVRVPTNSSQFESDIYLNIWFMRYAAAALAHGHLPALITTSLNAPVGINVMWNTSMLLPAVLLAPVTLLAGPTVSLAILLTVGFAASASVMYLVLRRWGASIGAAVAGGALYGFSPALMVAAEDHYHLQFAVLPPLILDAALRLAAGRSRRLLLTGAWLGLLVAAQIFIAEELLVDTALAGLIMLIVLVASRASAIRLRRLAEVAAGTVTATAVALLISGHALWVQFHGPLTENGSPWQVARSGIYSADFVTAPNAELLHGNFGSFLGASHQQPMEAFAYLGWPLLAALAAATIFFWRDARIRVAGLTFFVLTWLGLGSHRFAVAGWNIPLPWHWLLRVPVVSQAMPNRLPILADGAAAIVLAFAIDRARASVPARQAWRLPLVAAAVAAVLLPVIPGLVPATSVLAVPPGWQAVMAGMHLGPGAPVLVLPIDPFRAGRANAMEWQAMTGERISLVDGYCIVPDPRGKAVQCGALQTMTYPEHATLSDTYELGWGKDDAAGPTRGMLAVSITAWRPAAIVVVAGDHPGLARYMIRTLGPPALRQGSVLAWHIEQLRQFLTKYTSCPSLTRLEWSPCGSRSAVRRSQVARA
jgi:hypothetical protein